MLLKFMARWRASVRAKVVYVDSSAEIIGPVSCEQIEIHGSISGAIESKGQVTIKKTATVIGTLRYQSVSVDEGANIFRFSLCEC